MILGRPSDTDAGSGCTVLLDNDTQWMTAALALAEKAAALGEVPVGAVAVFEGRLVGEGANARELTNDPTAHAELIALQVAAKALGRWRLTGVTLYATLEPCPMCAGALVNARIDRLVYGARDPRAGAVGTLYDIPRDARLNHRVEVQEGVLADACSALLKSFFQNLRSRET